MTQEESQEEFERRVALERLTYHDFDIFTDRCRRCGMSEELWERAGRPTCAGAPS